MRHSVSVFKITLLLLFETMPIMLNIGKFPVNHCIPRGILCSFQVKARVSISGICSMEQNIKLRWSQRHSCNARVIYSKEVKYLCFHCCCVQSLVVLLVTVKFGERDDIWGFLHVNIKTLCILQCRLWLSWELKFHFCSPSFLMISSISNFQSSASVPD